MQYLPLFLNLQQQRCLVVGGGEVAARKLELLIKAGLDITVVALNIVPRVAELQKQHNLAIKLKAFEPDDIQNVQLVVAATDNTTLNAGIAAQSKALGVWVNVVDRPDLGNFIFPAIIDRSPLMVAVASGGASPVLTRLLRGKIESAIPSAFGKLAELADQFRPLVKQRISYPPQRRIFWERVLQGPIAELVFSGRMAQAEKLLAETVQQAQDQHQRGEVYLIGAGPGDPDLLTFKALRLMQQADVIVYDRLVAPAIVDLARRDAEKIYVGKERDNHSLPQDSINELLAQQALAGKRVARLKGGDPFIFGRGGEEIETLLQYGISFQVVPGVTAASGCASYSGIPLTHRDHAQSCTFVTGHLKDGTINLNWTQLAAPRQTVVIYMGLQGLPVICEQLMAHGCEPDHPVAIIQKGTTAEQKIVTGNLTNIQERVSAAALQSPTLIIVGTVVELHEKLNWFD
jgi:uroporphyrin-III C-methyltransferase/precorrin-2 dehydrogenase/sirohydrochlorin ferrochelatase